MDQLGGLSARRQPLEDVLHGWIWPKVPTKDPPQRIIPTVHCSAPSKDPVLLRIYCYEFQITQSKHLSRGHCWWTRST